MTSKPTCHLVVCCVQGQAQLNFGVTYHLEGQTSLEPHFDESTFTINVALTQLGVDHWVRMGRGS